MQTIFVDHPVRSTLHAASAVHLKIPLVDDTVSAEFILAASRLGEWIDGLGTSTSLFWATTIANCTGVESHASSAALIAKKIVGAEHGKAISGMLATSFSTLCRLSPGLQAKHQSEMQFRLSPLRAQWEAYGPGLLKAVGRLTSAELIVPRAEVIAVYPVTGGFGDSHLNYNSVRIEALLANPFEQVPEVVRLAWLVAQLNHDLPSNSENVSRDRVPLLSRLAMFIPALMAGQELGLCPSDLDFAEVATLWRVAADDQGTSVVDAVAAWWPTYASRRPPWNVALVALDRMLT